MSHLSSLSLLSWSLGREEQRANSYKLLSECYYQPNDQLLESLGNLDGPIAEPCLEIKRFVPQITELKSLVVDFSRLFIGPFKLLAAPYGSVYLEGAARLMGNSTMDVKSRYLKEGLDIAVNEVPDHIAIELEFIYLLIFKQMQAIRNSNHSQARKYLEKQSSFLNTHLGAWMPMFTDQVEKNANTLFYQKLARLTNSFITQDLKGLSTLDRT